MGSFQISSRQVRPLLAGVIVAVAASVAGANPSDLRTSQRFCRDHAACEAYGYQFRDLLNSQSTSPQVRDLLPRLHGIVGVMTDIWADTVLEENVDIDGAPVLDRVEGVFRDGQLAGYRITYSARAFSLGPDGERAADGRIRESAFATASLNEYFRDEGAVAEFFAQ